LCTAAKLGEDYCCFHEDPAVPSLKAHRANAWPDGLMVHIDIPCM